MSTSPVSKWILMAVGTLALSLGIIGIFVPLLPTTPFLLAAAACYLRSSERMYGWLLSHPWFGSFISNYRQHRAITKRNRILTLILLWGAIGYSSLSATKSLVVRVSLLAIAVGVTIHVISLRTMENGTVDSRNGRPTRE